MGAVTDVISPQRITVTFNISEDVATQHSMYLKIHLNVRKRLEAKCGNIKSDIDINNGEVDPNRCLEGGL